MPGLLGCGVALPRRHQQSSFHSCPPRPLKAVTLVHQAPELESSLSLGVPWVWGTLGWKRPHSALAAVGSSPRAPSGSSPGEGEPLDLEKGGRSVRRQRPALARDALTVAEGGGPS